MKTSMDAVTLKIGTGNDNIKVIYNFMSAEDHKKFYDYFKDIKKREDKNRYFNYPNELLSQEMQDLVFKYTLILRNKAEELYNLKFESDRIASLFIHPPGSELEPHSDVVEDSKIEIDDIARYKETDKNYKIPTFKDLKDRFPFGWSGHLSILIYINDDYEGGEIYFPDRGIEIKPKSNMFICFPGNIHYRHGVRRVKNNERFSLSLWTKFSDFKNELV
jgi:hypothetical protein